MATKKQKEQERQKIKKERSKLRSKCSSCNIWYNFGQHIKGEDSIDYIALNSTLDDLSSLNERMAATTTPDEARAVFEAEVCPAHAAPTSWSGDELQCGIGFRA